MDSLIVLFKKDVVNKWHQQDFRCEAVPKRLVQFQLLEKLTRANKFQIEIKTVDYLFHRLLPIQMAFHSNQLPL